MVDGGRVGKGGKNREYKQLFQDAWLKGWEWIEQLRGSERCLTNRKNHGRERVKRPGREQKTDRTEAK